MFPEAFKHRLISQNYINAEFLLKALREASPVSIRINKSKWDKIPIGSEPVSWCESGYYLKSRPSYTLDPLFHAGCYYPQEASSMFLESAIKQVAASLDNINVLDLCGAPGGKSTHISSLLGPGSMLIANEVIRMRASVLAETISKWGSSNAIVTQNDPSSFGKLPGYFDIILVDAPCSGEGMFRTEIAKNEWSVDNTLHCSERQKRILMDIWPSLKENGILIYSTCTFNPAENEENLKWLAENNEVESIRIPIQENWGVEEIELKDLFGYRFLPHKVKGEGFFLTLIRKKDGNSSYPIPKKIKSRLEKMPKQFAEVRNWLTSENSEFFVKSEFLIAFPEDMVPTLNALMEQLRVISFGLPVAQFKKNDLLPEHTFALSVDRNPDLFKSVELELKDALLFQKKDEIRIDSTTKGWMLVTYQGVPLGFVKNLGNRVNNYFPKEWRIRMALPELPQPWYK